MQIAAEVPYSCHLDFQIVPVHRQEDQIFIICMQGTYQGRDASLLSCFPLLFVPVQKAHVKVLLVLLLNVYQNDDDIKITFMVSSVTFITSSSLHLYRMGQA